jgi:hypothetical protein
VHDFGAQGFLRGSTRYEGARNRGAEKGAAHQLQHVISSQRRLDQLM